METKIYKADEVCLNDEDISADIKKVFENAGEIIRNGGLVAFPTETVYGLGANAFDGNAASKIYGAKDRPSDNPLIVHISDISQIEEIAEDVSKDAYKLMEKFWPGPLTIVLKKTEKVPYGTTGGLKTVAVRMPDHKVALKLIEKSGVPIAAPSANRSGRPSPTTAEHVYEDMNGRIDVIIDGGQVGIGIESTIIDMTGEIPMILRPGYITKEMLEAVVGTVLVDKVVLAKSLDELGDGEYKPKAPGMKYRHYAPKAELTMYEGTTEKVVARIKENAEKAENNGKKVGILCTDETMDMYDRGEIISIGSRGDNDSIAHNLYSVLRQFDCKNVDVIYGETFYDDSLGQAVMNRLIKAAGYRLEEV